MARTVRAAPGQRPVRTPRSVCGVREPAILIMSPFPSFPACGQRAENMQVPRARLARLVRILILGAPIARAARVETCKRRRKCASRV
jgi:hypothetical protein